MLTLDTLRSYDVLTVWLPPPGREKERVFLYTQAWKDDLNKLRGPSDKRAGFRISPCRASGMEALVNAFVAGQPIGSMRPPAGEALTPVFKRLRPPNEVIVEMRTTHLRTFGFIGPGREFVAICAYSKDCLQAKDPKYNQPITKVGRLMTRLADGQVDGGCDVEIWN